MSAHLQALWAAHNDAFAEERLAKRRGVSGQAYAVLLAARERAWTAFRDALREAFP